MAKEKTVTKEEAEELDEIEMHETATGLTGQEIFNFVNVLLEYMPESTKIRLLDMSICSDTKEHLVDMWAPVNAQMYR